MARKDRAFFLIFSLAVTPLISCAHNNGLQVENQNQSEVQKAITAAKISKTDSLEEKIQKTLRLINQERYYDPKGPQPMLGPPYDNRYHLDSLRTPEQILEQKVGGFCGSAALVFAAMLNQAGVPRENLAIVAGVYARDLSIICPKAGVQRVENPRTGASGHVFVAVKFAENDWRLINTIDGTNYEWVSWFSPDQTESQIEKAPLQIPYSIYDKLPPNQRSLPMVVFQSWPQNAVPIHTFDQRLDLIASGTINDSNSPSPNRSANICRYGAAEMLKLKPRASKK